MSELVTGPYLGYLREAIERSNDEQSWLVTTSADIEGVRVLEYTPTRFKAIGRGVVYTDKVTSAGETIKSLLPQWFRTIFVFAREDGEWKAVAVRDTFARDWEYVPDWMRDELGDVPSYIDKDCLFN